MAVSTTPVFTGSDINFLHKNSGYKTFRTRVQSSVPQPRQCFIKGWVEWTQTERSGMYWYGFLWAWYSSFKSYKKTSSDLRVASTKMKRKRGENIQESCVDISKHSCKLKLYEDMEIIIKSSWNKPFWVSFKFMLTCWVGICDHSLFQNVIRNKTVLSEDNGKARKSSFFYHLVVTFMMLWCVSITCPLKTSRVRAHAQLNSFKSVTNLTWQLDRIRFQTKHVTWTRV